MGEENIRRKPSLISIIILFLVIILITILLIKQLEVKSISNESNALLNTSSPEYIASKKEEINSYITDIKELYGIDIVYGEETLNYAVKVNATILDDLNIVNNNIKVLFHTLEKYPKDMFKLFKNKEYKIDVVLLNEFNNNNLALASKNNLNEIKLYVSNTYDFERALHHELFHVFEYYMSDKNKEVFNEWNNFNPKNFTYEANVLNLDSSYVYLKKEESNQKDSYFVTKYAKTSAKEDRAETFAEIMMLTKKPNYLEEGENIRKKADNILDNMSKYLNIKNIYCSRFVK